MLSFPKDKKTAATVRKHQVGQKIGGGATAGGGAEGDGGMSNLINAIKSGAEAPANAKKLPAGAQKPPGAFDPKSIALVSLRSTKK